MKRSQFAILLMILIVGLFGLALATGHGPVPHNSVSSTPVTSGNELSTYVNQSIIARTGFSFLRTNGTEITDEFGDAIILRGVDFSGYEHIPPLLSLYIHQQSDYETIASWGFNVVRLPISWENIEPRPGYYNDSYLTAFVDRDIRWARQYGIYIVLDMHQICWSSHFANCNGGEYLSAGVPDWAVGKYPDSDDGIESFLHDFFSGTGPNGTVPTTSNPSMQSRFFAAWQHVALRYRNESAIAAYDVLNEPPSTTPASFYTNAIDAIRAVDQNHICLWETDTSIPRENVVYSPHYPQDSLTSYNAASLRSGLQRIISYSRMWNVPVFIGEWGMYGDTPGVDQYINDSLTMFDSYSVSAAWWTYTRGNFPMDLFYDNGTARGILVQNLVRPFVRAFSSPTVQSSSFNVNDGSFTLTQTFSSTGRVQILVAVPDKYSVVKVQTITGAPIDSQFSQEDRTLLLTFPGAATVTVICNAQQ